MTAAPKAAQLPAATYLLSLAQAINLTAAVISVTVAALVGNQLAPNAALGTVPYGIQFAAVMLSTYPAAMLMRRKGRRFGFAVGAVLLILAGLTGYLSVSAENFLGLTVSHALLGAYIACANFYRFAAVDRIASALQAKALSLVISGGVLAALVGPLLSTLLRDVAGQKEFSVCYAAFSGLGLLTLLVLAFWQPAAGAEAAPSVGVPAPSPRRFSGHPLAWVAMLCAAGGYLIMNLLMVQASLVMKGLCSFSASSLAIQAHVLAMFAPSFFTGSLIAKVGVRSVLMLGFGLLGVAAGIAVFQPQSYDAILAGLVFLGLGWNFVYVAGGALLAHAVPGEKRHAWQGANDTLIAACATLGAFLPAPLLSAFGWSGSNLMALLLCLALGVVCWVGFSIGTPSTSTKKPHASSP
jgi:MFS family permease